MSFHFQYFLEDTLLFLILTIEAGSSLFISLKRVLFPKISKSKKIHYHSLNYYSYIHLN